MIKNYCQHEWEKHTNASREMGAGTISAYFICKKCNTILTASEALQLEALENQTKSLENQTKLAQHQLGFQKWLSVLAFIASIIAIIIAGLK